jgi:hypothetical protein
LTVAFVVRVAFVAFVLIACDFGRADEAWTVLCGADAFDVDFTELRPCWAVAFVLAVDDLIRVERRALVVRLDPAVTLRAERAFRVERPWPAEDFVLETRPFLAAMVLTAQPAMWAPRWRRGLPRGW